MKKETLTYEKPQTDIEKFETTDVITTSSGYSDHDTSANI